MKIYPVIMCGGSGTRLWPLSVPERPKQFIPLVAERSSFQSTVQRLAAIKDAVTPLVIAGLAHADWIRLNLAAIGATADILLEPEPRDSAAAVAVAAAWVAARDPDGVIAIVAADHHVPDAEAFARAVETAALAAAEGWIVTLGVRPDAPATAYGYIAAAEPIAGPVLAVSRFVEKPDLERAKAYVDSGYLWNSGNFIARASTLLAAFDAFAPTVGDGARRGVETASATPVGAVLGAAFLDAPKISFDYAVMEKADRVAVLPVSFAWSDLGAWDAIWTASARDGLGNAVQGEGRLIEVTDSLVRLSGTSGPSITILGLSNIAVVGDDRNLLIAGLASSQGVKQAAQLAAPAPIPPEERLARHADVYERWLRTAALPLWSSLGGDPDGGYYDLIDQDGRPVAAAMRRARVQARQSFVYAEALNMGLPGAWRSASEHGLAYMRGRFRRADGLFRTSVDSAGAPLDEDAYLYDQAFVLLALAAQAKNTAAPEPLRLEAEALLTAIEQAMAHPAGGFREAGRQPFQANAHMHLLEAALAWIEAGGGSRWQALAEQIVELALGRFIDPDRGFLREFFDAAWAPAPGDDGRQVEPGHQFEWAWLMVRWARVSGATETLITARTLFRAGLRGVDGLRGVAMDELNEIDHVRSARARLWPQTEYLKAALTLAAEEHPSDGGGEYLVHAARAAGALWRYLETPVTGLWRDKMLEDAGFVDEPAPASSLYHIIGAVAALRTYATAAHR
jgi:mannose-1-phosphate guanylyltransferase/mannose-6-phosphate isomerase